MNSARRTVTFVAAGLADADGVKESFATVAAPVALDTTDWDGAAITSAGVFVGAAVTGEGLPRTVTLTFSNNAGQFSTDDIVLTGTRGGAVVTETLNAADADGNVTLRGTQVFDTLTGVDLPAMGGTGGTITIGVQDICAPKGTTFTGVELAAAGTLNLGWGTDSAVAHADAILVTAASAETIRPIAASRILTSAALSNPTTVGLTVYLP